jgi:hypothetical protein
MKTRYPALAALMLLVFGAWTTNKSSGTDQYAFAFSSTGQVIPDSAAAGRTFISVADIGGTGAATFWIYSSDAGTMDSMLVTLGAGSAWESNFPHGIDSVVVASNATTLGFHVSN